MSSESEVGAKAGKAGKHRSWMGVTFPMQILDWDVTCEQSGNPVGISPSFHVNFVAWGPLERLHVDSNPPTFNSLLLPTTYLPRIPFWAAIPLEVNHYSHLRFLNLFWKWLLYVFVFSCQKTSIHWLNNNNLLINMFKLFSWKLICSLIKGII